MDSSAQLRISEIFYSLQGETTFAGLPTVFIRLTGCPLRCQYCDTAYAFHGGKKHTLSEIMQRVSQYQTRYVTVTGGEPLAQKLCLDLLRQLCDAEYTVSLETSGAMDISPVDSRVIKIMDLKTPASAEVDKNRYDNIRYLQPQDQVKIVICNREDYEWAKTILLEYGLLARCVVLFSPSYQQIEPKQLATWILEDQLAVRMQLQIHKYIWGDVAGV